MDGGGRREEVSSGRWRSMWVERCVKAVKVLRMSQVKSKGEWESDKGGRVS